MSNALGEFHQKVLGGVDGWINHDAGYDLECPARRILAEVKNKHNTMNTSNREKVIGDLDTAVRQKGRGWTGCLVVVVPKRPERYARRITNREVYETDGASFYHEVTGSPNALHDLFDTLCNELTPSSEITAYCERMMAQSFPARF